MVDILNKIAAYKREEVKTLLSQQSRTALEKQARISAPPRGFLRRLETVSATRPALIAEVKKASPSKGLIRADFNPPRIAKSYAAGGAACLSVLTDGPSFMGSAAAFTAARSAVSLPALRKDFMIDIAQIFESRIMEADCILIIMAMIDDALAKDLYNAAQDLGMDALIETHDQAELDRALKLGGRLIGINNRNLRSFETTLDTFKNLAKNVPDNAFLVAESGIFTPQDIELLAGYGAQSFLVGESLMRQEDVTAATKALIGG